MKNIGLPELLLFCGLLFLFSFALFLLVTALRWRQSRSIQKALIDKLSASELATVLQTPGGEKLIRALSEGDASPGRDVLRAVRKGIVMILGGLGMTVAGRFSDALGPSMELGALLAIFIGIGLLVSAFVTYRLSKRWGLLEQNGNAASNRQAN